MIAIEIEIDEGRTAFRPGGRVGGRLSWSLEAAQDAIEIRLFWYTGGEGDRDVAIVDRRRLTTPPPSGSRVPFRFDVPAGPWSFSGSLVTLSWALEAVALPSNESALLGLVVSPTLEEIRLSRLEP